MKVYLARSIAAGRKSEKYLKLICNELESLGHKVMTKENVVANSVKYNNETSLKKRKEIVKRDKNWIKKCDVFIAEVSTYSHGVGYEHSYAESLKKPILLLRHKSLKGEKYTVFFDGTGYKKLKFVFYDKKNLPRILIKFFEMYL